jgi:hypothetical protein
LAPELWPFRQARSGDRYGVLAPRSSEKENHLKM